MNKKGFTLVEIIVTIGLLALLGVGIGVSLTKVLKNQDENSYETFIEKVKSASTLYISNNSKLINDLESNKGYILITINDLISNGYLREDLTNPKTGEKIKDLIEPSNPNEEDYSQTKVYYSMDKEMIIEYPFIKPTEDVYLNVINYTTLYKTNETGLCYKGLNTSSLGLTLVESGGLLNKNLVAGSNIIAYMEDGSECSDANLNTNKVGTYKIRYVYTINGDNAKNNPDAKSATRNVIIKPTKPSIIEFEVKPQTKNDIYYANYTAKIKEIAFEEILYCINYYDANASYKANINDCKTWKTLNNKNSNNEFVLDISNVNLKQDYPDIENKELVSFYLFVKNSFEEYDYKKMTNDNGEYRLTSTVYFNLEAGSNKVYLKDMKTEISNPVEIKRIKNNTKFSQVMTDSNYGNNKYNRITRNGYYFDGWYTEKEGAGTKYTKDTTAGVYGVLDLYAYWKKDDEKPTCTISGTSSGLTATPKDNYGTVSGGKWSPDNSLTLETHTFTLKDWAGNEGSCSATITEQSSKEETYTYQVDEPYTSCTGGGYTNKFVEGSDSEDYCKRKGYWYCVNNCYAGPGCYISVKEPETCETLTRTVTKTGTRTVWYCPSGKEISGTYKCIS